MRSSFGSSINADAAKHDLGAQSNLYTRIIRQTRPYWLHLLGVLLLSMLASPLALLIPLPLKLIVDSAIGTSPLPWSLEAVLPRAGEDTSTGVLILAAILMVGIGLLLHLQQMMTGMLGAYTAEKVVLDFRARLFQHSQRLSISYHDRKGTADALHRIQWDANALRYVTIDGLIPFVSASLTLIGMMYVTLRINWQLALVAVAVSPILFVLSMNYRPLLRDKWDHVRELESSALSIVHEVLGALRVVQAFGREEHEQKRYIKRTGEGMKARLHLAWVEGRYALIVGMTMALGTTAVLVIGTREVRAGSMSLGSLLLVMAYIGQLYGPLKTIGRKSASLQGHLASVRRAFRLLDEAPDVVDRPNARRLQRASGSIQYRHVSFCYQAGHPVLRDVSFDVPVGAWVGIAGRTGAGKTTLVSLLIRFHDVTSGQILLDNVDLRDYAVDDLRNQFSIVLQEPVLFSTAIAENIRYARPEASSEEIIRAAKLANAHDFIMGLPDGYLTLVGERGMRLSGGERQRISLARAFLKDAPVLILDEPTSAIDTRTEASIMEAMERLARGRTTFMIAHRVGTLDKCDLRLLLDNGRLENVNSNATTIRAEAAPAAVSTKVYDQ
jgi:ATP-binding cassette, subfamily B, bacterial